MADPNPTYRMTLSLNVLKHLGIGLYSNVPAVLSEVVANAWDADARNVEIKIDPDGEKITIIDDGHGMSVDDANEKYLYVGYERRNQKGGGTTPKFKREVMGRKGIGKLSLFSIAKTIEIHSAKDEEIHGFILNTDDIEEMIQQGGEKQYYPEMVPSNRIQIQKGTKIILTDVKRRLDRSSMALRRKLARRFSIIGPDHHFHVILNGREISPEDRGYEDKIQYIWTFGERGAAVGAKAKAKNRVNIEARQPDVDVDGRSFEIGGWIGTARKAGDLKDPETHESLNGIVILVRGKLAQEDILDKFSEGGLFSKYVFGEIHADFLDQDEETDIATTSRQKVVEDDPRYLALHNKLQTELKYIQSRWTNLRNEEGARVAEQIPAIKEWMRGLDSDHRHAAQKLFGRINQLPIDSDADRRQIFVGNILAFESLRFRKIIHRIEEISVNNLDALSEIFTQLDDIEASSYYLEIQNRLKVIETLTGLVKDNEKERAIQEHLSQHLWLVEPSWGHASEVQIHVERQITSAINAIYSGLTNEEKRSRLDIRYTTTGKRHVIIELKRANVSLLTSDLEKQIEKYHAAVSKVLEADSDLRNDPLEFICVIGKPLRDWSNPRQARQRSIDRLAALDARVVTYDELINGAQRSYRDYLGKQKEAGKLYELITSISDADFKALSPDPGSEPD